MNTKSNGSDRPHLWTANYVATLAGNFAFFGSFFALLSVLPDYVEEIGGQEWHVGLIVGGTSMLPLFIWPLVGHYSDHGRRRRVMQLAAFITVVALLLSVISEDIWSLLAIRIALGASVSMFPTAAASLVGVSAPPSRRGEAVGYYGMSTSGAQMAFPALGVVIAGAWGFDVIFFSSAAVGAAALIFASTLSEPPAPPPSASQRRLPMVPLEAVFPMLIFTTLTFAFTAAAAFLPLLGDDRDLGNVGLYFLVSGAFAMAIRPFAGRLSDRRGRSTIIVPGIAVLALGMAILARAETPAIMLVAGAVGGLGFGAAHTGLFALAFDRVPAAQRGGATAVFRLSWDVGGLAGSLGLGLIATVLSLEATFWIAAGLLAAAVGAYGWGRALGFTRPYVEPSPSSAP